MLAFGKASGTSKALLFFTLLVCITFWPVFLGRVPLSTDDITQYLPFRQYYPLSVTTPHAELGDPITEFYPWHKFAAESIRRGVFPLWNPYLLGGTPFQANFLSTLFYPVNLIYIILPMPAAWSLALMLKPLLAAAFMFLLLREVHASTSGAVVGGIVFAFSGSMTAWRAWPQVDTALWLPLLCFQIHRLHREPTLKNALWLALIAAMPILAGHPGIAAHVFATAAAYALWLLLSHPNQTYRPQIFWFFVAASLGLGLSAVQLVPSIEWLGQIGRTLDFRWPYLPAWHAIGFFSRDLSRTPNTAGIPIPQAAVYAGALSLLAVPFAFLQRDKRDSLFFSIVLFVSISTAYELTPIASLSDSLPFFAGLKKDEALMLVNFSLAVLAGLGISQLETMEWKDLKTVERVGAFTILILATAALHLGADALSKMTTRGVVDWWRSPRSFRVLLIAGALLIAFRILRLLSRRQWLALASVASAVDLVSFGYGHIPFNKVETIYPNVPLFDFLAHQEQPFRILSLDMATPPNAESVYGLSTVSGYDFMLKRPWLLTDHLIDTPSAGLSFRSRNIVESPDRILDLLNVRYLITTGLNKSEANLRSQPDRFRQIWSSHDMTMFENRRVLPRVLLVPRTKIEIIPSEDAQLGRIKDRDFDPENTVILPERPSSRTFANTSGFAVSELPQGLVKYSEDINRVDFEVNARTASVAVVSQIYYPGWKVFVDKRPAELLRPDYAFTGVLIDAGRHEVELRFRPQVFVIGSVISVGSLLLIVASAVRTRKSSIR